MADVDWGGLAGLLILMIDGTLPRSVNGPNAKIILRDGVAVLDMQLAPHELATRSPQFPFPATEALI